MHNLISITIFTLFLTSQVMSQCLSANDNAGPTPKESGILMSESSVKYATNQMKKLVDSKPGQNVFISPYSIWSALTLTYLGAKGRTASELANTLGFSGVEKTTVGRGYQQLNNDLKKIQKNSKSTLALASKVIFDDTINVRECMVENYFDELARVNFTLMPSESRERINFWVQDQTEDKIKDLIPDGGITSQTRLVIVNAVYFKGEWYQMFDQANTRKEPFTLSSGTVQNVDMMKIKTQLFYGEDPTLGAQLVELPYSSGDFSMLMMLPAGDNTANDVINKLNAKSLDNAIGQMLEANIVLKMPKFKLEDGYDLVQTLANMGVNSLFGNADLSGYTDEPLFVSSVIHKAVIEVNEKGTEAAGATAVIMSRTSRLLSDITMTVDKPFVFLIRDNNHNVVLFMGVVNNPGGQPASPALSYF